MTFLLAFPWLAILWTRIYKHKSVWKAFADLHSILTNWGHQTELRQQKDEFKKINVNVNSSVNICYSAPY